MKYAVVEVRQNEANTTQVTVVPWEAAILQALHGEHAQVVDEYEVADDERELPDAAEEYQRLANKYSRNREQATSVVAEVYGPGERGIEALGKEINKADSFSVGKNERVKALKSKQDTEKKAMEQRQQSELKQLEQEVQRQEKQRERDREREEAEEDEDEERARGKSPHKEAVKPATK